MKNEDLYIYDNDKHINKLHQDARDIMEELDKKYGREQNTPMCLDEYLCEYYDELTLEERKRITKISEAF